MSSSTRGATKVRRVVVGKPIRRINPVAGNINTLNGVDTTGSVNGSLLVYNSSTGNYEATTLLENQEVNGGQY